MKNIRNFAIIAHVDHGKSTLADRMLEITGTILKRDMQDQLLDSNPIERERGITIKLAPVRMSYPLDSQDYILNLIDTPGHVDFSYEVNRSLAACEGVVLLVDATQGIQAQTLAHFREAQKLNLVILPVVNKIDISTADIESTVLQIIEVFGFRRDEILFVSGKTGAGVPELLREIVRRIPPPEGNPTGELKALVFNSNFDPHLGVVAWIRVINGQVSPRDKLFLLGSDADTNAVEVGVFTPAPKTVARLESGEVGYVVTTLREISLLNVGDTLTSKDHQLTTALPGYRRILPVVFVSFYPTSGEEISSLRDALYKLRLQDSALEFTPEFSPALGNGFRVGFLGMLHADIVQERLEREFNISLIAAAPSVSYLIKKNDNSTITISKPVDLPDPSQIQEICEPAIKLYLFTPEIYIGPIMQLCQEHRGSLLDMRYIGRLAQLTYTLPLAELIHQFYDQLKSLSQGFATLDYEHSGFISSDLVRMDILISGERIDALSQIISRAQAPRIGIQVVERLKTLIPRQQFEIVIQAAVGSHIYARSEIKAFRKDVIAKLSGGDQTRKDKLLKKQKKGKSRLKRIGRVDIPQEAFLSVLLPLDNN